MPEDDTRYRPIPSGRLARLGSSGWLAGGMVAEGTRRLAAGQRPSLGEVMLKPGNAARVADRLSHLRGAEADQPTRDRAVTALVSLVLRELFAFGVMQTDPHFANHHWQPGSGRLVLLAAEAIA